MSASASPSPFPAYRKALFTELRSAKIHFSFWKELRNATETNNAEMNLAPGFFGQTIRAHMNSTLFSLFRVLDSHPESLNVFRLMNWIGKHGAEFRLFDQTVLRDQRKRLRAFAPIIENLRMWRDKQYAHLDISTVEGAFSAQDGFPVTVGDVDQLISTCAEIINHWSVRHDGTYYSMDFAGVRGLDSVLSALQAYRQQRDEARRR